MLRGVVRLSRRGCLEGFVLFGPLRELAMGKEILGRVEPGSASAWRDLFLRVVGGAGWAAELDVG